MGAPQNCAKDKRFFLTNSAHIAKNLTLNSRSGFWVPWDISIPPNQSQVSAQFLACVAQSLVQWCPIGKAEKLKAKIMDPAQVRNVAFADAVFVLQREGFVWDLGSGSHHVYRHPDGRRVTLPKHGSELKPVYVRAIRELLKP